MFFPPPDLPPEQSKQGPGEPDLALLVLLWLFAATLGLYFGYLPPPFKPQWLYKLVLASIFVAWIGLGILLLIFGGGGFEVVIYGVVAILVGIGGLSFVLLHAETGTNQNGTRDAEKTRRKREHRATGDSQ
jgi:hypothetical protein